MGIHSFFEKISSITSPERFIRPESSKPRLWISGERIVEETVSSTSRIAESKLIYQADAPRIVLTLTPLDKMVTLSSVCDGDSKEISRHYTQTLGQAISLYQKFYRNLTVRSPGAGISGGKKFVLWVVGSLAVAYMSLSLVGSLMSATERPQYAGSVPAVSAQPYPSAMAPTPVMSPQQAQQASAQTEDSSKLTAAERKLIAAKASKVSLSNSGEELLVFSDPQCPYCRSLESSLEESVKKGKITIVPVAYKPGSVEIVASVLCSKDQAAAWKKVMATGQAAGAVCDAGVKRVEQNNQLFAELRFTATPTLVSPKGIIVASNLSSEQVEILLKN